MVLGLLLFACQNNLDLTAFPSKLDFGEVDFHQSMPDGGFSPLELSLTNTGERDVDLTVVTFDFEHLCLEGYTSVPNSLGSLSPASNFILMVSVCDYIEEAGERDDLLEGFIDIDYGADSPLSVQWSFTPVLNISSDTGN